MALKHYLYIIVIGLAGLFCSGAFFYSYRPVLTELAAQPNAEASLKTWKLYVNNKRYALYVKKNDLLNNMKEFMPSSHEAKTVFRLTVPALMKIFNLNVLGIYVLQLVLGLFIGILLAYISYGITGNYYTTTLFTIAAACTYYGQACFLDNYIWGDTFSFFFILTGICFRKKPLLLMLSVFALFFCDERGIMAIPLIWLCIKTLDQPKNNSFNWQNLLSLKDGSIYLYIALAISAALRVFLALHYGLALPSEGNTSVGLGIMLNNWKDLQRGLFAGLEGLWGLIFLTIVQSFLDKNRLLSVGLMAITCLFAITACLVQDITRSITFLLPVCFIGLWYFKNEIGTLNKVLIAICAINLFYPSTIIVSGLSERVTFPFLYHIAMHALDWWHSTLK